MLSNQETTNEKKKEGTNGPTSVRKTDINGVHDREETHQIGWSGKRSKMAVL